MNMRSKLFLRLTPFLSRRIHPLRSIDRSKYLFLRWLLDKYRIELVLDVGGNVGQFARSLRRLGYRGDIVSFEPQPDIYQKLAKVARSDARWQTYDHALGAEAGRREINIMASNSMSSFFEPTEANTSAYAKLNTVVGTRSVEIKRLDEVIGALGLPHRLDRCLLKSDTQGFDLEVLHGAGSSLDKIRLLMLEVSTVGLYESAPGLSEMLTFLDGRGFAPLSFFPVGALPDDSVPEFDYLAINRRLGAG